MEGPGGAIWGSLSLLPGDFNSYSLVVHLFPPVWWPNIEDQHAWSWLISRITAHILCDYTSPHNILDEVHIPLDVGFAIPGPAVSNQLRPRQWSQGLAGGRSHHLSLLPALEGEQLCYRTRPPRACL